MKRILTLIVLLGLSLAAGAQSPRFKLGKWTEIQTAILQELNRSYVDSLPVETAPTGASAPSSTSPTSRAT